MTESDWLACTDPQPMLEFLRGKASDRKLRLFAVACCRDVPETFHNPRTRPAVDLAERFADGDATVAQLVAAEITTTRIGRRTILPSAADAADETSSYAAWF